MDPKTLTWTPPSEIDGEPSDVKDLVQQQLVDAATVVSILSNESYIQLRAEGLEHHEALEDWEASPEGEAAESVRAFGLSFARSVRELRLLN